MARRALGGWLLRGSRILLPPALYLLLVSACATGDLPRLIIGEEHEGLLGPGETIEFQLEVPDHSYLYFGVDQGGVDLRLSLLDPEGHVVDASDGPAGPRGQEVIALLLNQGGSYRVRLAAKNRSPIGTYTLWIDALRNQEPGDADRAEAERLFAEATHYLALGTEDDRLRSIELLEASLTTWKELGDIAAQATTLDTIGRALMWLGRLVEAEEKSRLAIELRRNASSCRSLAIGLSNRGVILSRMGDYSSALEVLEESLELRTQCGLSVVNVLMDISYVYRDLGDFDLARRKIQEAIDQERSLPNPTSQINRMAELAWLNSQMGNHDGALEVYAEAIRAMQVDMVPEVLAGIYRRRGMTWFVLGHFQNALDDFRSYLELSESAGDLSASARASAHLGRTLLALGRPEAALRSLDNAVEMSRQAGDRQRQTLSLLLRGTALFELQRADEAIQEQKDALQLAEEIGGFHYEALAREALADSYLQTRDFDSADEQIRLGVELARRTGSLPLEGRLLTLDGRAARLAGRFVDAKRLLTTAIDLAGRTSDRSTEVEALLEMARLDRTQGALGEAKIHVEEALLLVEGMRLEVVEEELRSTFLAARVESFGLMVDLLMELAQTDPEGGFAIEALAVSERSRARSLLDLIEEARTPNEPPASELLRREEALRQRVSDLRLTLRRLSEGSLEQKKAAAELDRSLEEYSVLQSQLHAQKAGFRLAAQPRPEDLQALENQLGDETMLVEYYLGEERGYVWWVTAAGVGSTRVGSRSQIEGLVREAYHQLTERNRTVVGESPRARRQRWDLADSRYWGVARQLAAELLPVELQEAAPKRWVIVPDGALHYLPFAALPNPRSPDGVRALVLDYEVTMAPSLTVVARLFDPSDATPNDSDLSTERDAASGQLLVVADPVFERTDPRIPQSSLAADALSEELEESGFQRLRFSRSEGEEILALVPPEDRLGIFGFDATPALLETESATNYKWIHFATHAVIDADRPGLSGLALSMFDRDGQARNGFVRLLDLYRLDLNAELVVLSGCQTARGKELRGEGIVGLTRGFLHAGVPRVVSSIWEVQDKATRELMVRFYRHLVQDGESPSAALRAAQIELLHSQNWRSPYYWAPFALQGRWD